MDHMVMDREGRFLMDHMVKKWTGRNRPSRSTVNLSKDEIICRNEDQIVACLDVYLVE